MDARLQIFFVCFVAICVCAFSSCEKKTTEPVDTAIANFSPVLGKEYRFRVDDEYNSTTEYHTTTFTSREKRGDTTLVVALNKSVDDNGVNEWTTAYVAVGSKWGVKLLYGDVLFVADIDEADGTVIDSMDFTRTGEDGTPLGKIRMRVVCGRNNVPVVIGDTTFSTREMYTVDYTLQDNNVLPGTADTSAVEYYVPSIGSVKKIEYATNREVARTTILQR